MGLHKTLLTTAGGLDKLVTNTYRSLVVIISSRQFLVITLAWFTLQAVFFAVRTHVGVPPDENYHLGFIQLFAQHGISPLLTSQDGFYGLGEAVKTPFFLFHYLLSLPYHLFGNWQYAYVVLRLLNVAMALGSLYLVLNISTLLKLPKSVRNLSMFMLTNTLMFVFLSGAISYDNLFVLLSLATIFILLRLRIAVTATPLLTLLVVVLMGCMVKVNYLPIAAITGVVFLVIQRKKLPQLPGIFIKSFSSKKSLNMLLSLLVVLLGCMFVYRYVGNLMTYHTYEPKCEQVLPIEKCRESALFVRNEAIYGYDKRPSNLGPARYFKNWVPLILERTYGVFAHKILDPPLYVLVWVSMIGLLGLVGCFYLDRSAARLLWIPLLFSLGYLLVVFMENYSIYSRSGRVSFAVHGRYLFAVLPLFYLLINYAILEGIKSRLVRMVFISVSLLVFLSSSWPAYILQTGSEWYADSSKIHKEDYFGLGTESAYSERASTTVPTDKHISSKATRTFLNT